MRHLRILVADGFLEDTTPGLRNRPHIYVDTGKVVILCKVAMPEWGVSERDSKAQDDTQEIGSTA